MRTLCDAAVTWETRISSAFNAGHISACFKLFFVTTRVDVIKYKLSTGRRVQLGNFDSWFSCSKRNNGIADDSHSSLYFCVTD